MPKIQENPEESLHQNDVDCIMFRLKTLQGESLEAFEPYLKDHQGNIKYAPMFATHKDKDTKAALDD